MFFGGEVIVSRDQEIAMRLRRDPKTIVEALNDLREATLFWDRSVTFSYHEPRVIELLRTSQNTAILENAAFCLRTALEANLEFAHRMCTEFGAVPVVMNVFNSLKHVATCEHCVHVINDISKLYGTQIAIALHYPSIFTAMKTFTGNVEKRILMSLFANMSGQIIDDNLVNHIPDLLEHVKSPDAQISKDAFTALVNVLSKAQLHNITDDLISFVAENIQTTQQQSVREQLITVLPKVLKSPEKVRIALQENIDFEKLLFSSDVQNNTTEFQRKVVRLIIALLPNVEKYAILGLSSVPKPPESDDFARTIQSLLIRCILEKPLCQSLLLLGLAVTLQYEKYEPTDEFVMALLSMTAYSDNAVYILAVVSSFDELSKLSDCGIMSALLQHERLMYGMEKWFRATYCDVQRKLVQSQIKTPVAEIATHSLPEIAEMIRNETLSPIRFLYKGGVKHVQALVDGIEGSMRTADLDVIAKFVFSMVKMVNLPHCFFEPQIGDLLDHFEEETIVTVRWKNKTYRMQVPIKEQLSFAEGLLLQKVMKERIQTIMARNPKLASYVDIDQNRLVPAAHVPVLYKAFCGGERMCFDGRYTGNSSIIGLMCDKAVNSSSIFSGSTPAIRVTATASPDILFTMIPEATLALYGDLFELLRSLFLRFGYMHVTDSFVSRVHNQMAYPYNSIGRFSYAVTILFKYPFLFPFTERIFIFKLVILEPYIALRRLVQEFHYDDQRILTNFRVEPLKLFADRKSIFEDGRILVDQFMCNRTPVEIQFRNEVGIGLGPTREFFSLLSREFRKSSRHLFRNDNPKAEYCYHELGLFPSIIACSSSYYTLGILVAKAISMEMTLDLDFNPTFFDLVRCQVVSIDTIDKFIANALKSKEGLYGLPFTYPGYDDYQLIGGGRDIFVTEANVNDYIACVTETTLGKNVRDCAAAFKSGFDTVFPFMNLDIFSSAEIACIISGDDALITADDLNNYLEISHGYTRESPEIQMLIEVILEMTPAEQRDFIRFVTGSQRLPVGGMKGLEPHMTVMKRTGEKENEDTDLPTTSTCTYLLKLPSYSTKDIMRSKLLMAITNCQESFDLT